MRWMNLEPIIQSEVNQKKKDKYHILTHIHGIQKNGTEEFIYRAANQPWDFFGRNDAKAETPVLWPPHAKS